jgi:hypothetical protein
VAFSRGADFRPSQSSPSGQIVAQALNVANEATAPERDAPLDAALNHRAGDSEASFARSYERARATIASDEELRTAVRGAKNAGDEKFNDRLATIMVNLEQDPQAAFDAIRSEIFNSQIRHRAGMSAAAAMTALATWNAINRLDALQPKLNIWKAREAGFRPAVGLSQEEGRTLYRIATDERLSRDDRLHQMADAGLFDTALAAGLMGAAGWANRGGVLAPTDRPGGGPNRASTPNLPSRPAVEPKPPAVPNSGEVFVRSPRSDSPRYRPGTVTGKGVKIEGPWLPDITEAPVPAQVADLLRGRRFSSFDDLREAFWKAVASVPELASQFNTQNRALMSRGRAPKAPGELQTPDSMEYHLHHPDRVADGGPVYHLDNIWVVSPLRHRRLHSKGSP